MTFVVGISNSRLATAKRGIAVELAAQLAKAVDTPVCLVGADPADRDVERHLPRLAEAWGRPAHMEITSGTHHVTASNFTAAGVCAISVSDRESVELVFPLLESRFSFLVVDAPSRTGFGVGIADVLLPHLDALIVATGLTAGELAETRSYVDRLESRPGARRVERRVLPVGEASESGLALEQLEWRLALLPALGHVPRLGGGVARQTTIETGVVETAFRPVVRWIIDQRERAIAVPAGAGATAATGASTVAHVANRLYREHD
jgi:hypothetical protein